MSLKVGRDRTLPDPRFPRKDPNPNDLTSPSSRELQNFRALIYKSHISLNIQRLSSTSLLQPRPLDINLKNNIYSQSAMVKSGYARLMVALAKAKNPPPTRQHDRQRLETLFTFIARGVKPGKFPLHSRKKFRGSLDPKQKDEGLSYDNPKIDSLAQFVERIKGKLPEDLHVSLRIMVLETRIYLLLRKLHEVVVDAKFQNPILKANYKKWVSP